jgi:hypothetical protein
MRCRGDGAWLARPQSWTLAGVATFLMALGCGIARAQPAPTLSVEQLLTDGWEIAGYGALSFEARSFILFKHKDRHYLVQCSVLFDVLRAKRVVTNCYEVH